MQGDGVLLGYIATIVSVITAIVSTLVSYRSLKIADKSADATIQTVELFKEELEDNTLAKNMELHYSVVQMIRNLQLQFPPDIGKDDYIPPPEVERLIFVFWFLVFDEWFGCMIEGKYMVGYWDKYYEKELAGVVTRPAFRNVIKKMVEVSQISFLGQSDKFSLMLDEIHVEETGEHLFEKYKEPKSEDTKK